MIKNNYHTHTKYCNHAKGTVEDYVKAAIAYGFNELGMSDHAPIPSYFMNEVDYKRNYCDENMTWDTALQYLDDIEKCKEKYKGQIKIYKGFESEFLPKHLDFYKKLKDISEYLNIGIHFYEDFDGNIIDSYHDVTYKNVDAYVACAISAMESGLFNTLVHPELYMYGYKSVNNKREFDDIAIDAAKKICEAAIKYNVYLEINANGIRNSERHGHKEKNDWLYPCVKFWEIAREYKDLKIIIGADAHTPEALGYNYVEMACQFAKELNLSIEEEMKINH